MLLCCFAFFAMIATFTTMMLGIFAVIVSKVAALGSGGGGNSKKVLLKNVKSLTLRKDKNTSHRRVSAVPQLKCVGGSGCRHYQVEVMRCENAGSDYDDDSIQWTCKATIPEDFKLGSTDVRCEGYKNSHDPFVLKGSCGVEYRLLLTDKGMEKYGYDKSFNLGNGASTSNLFSWIFWLAFFGVVFVMARSAWRNMRNNTGRRRPPHTGAARPSGPPFDGGDGGGGGPWFGGDNDDPPPPYTPFTKSSSSSAASGSGQQAWRPGFWTGAAAGAAATYFGSRGNNSRQYDNQSGAQPSRNTRQSTRSWSNNGEGSSSSSSSTNWHSSTGFGSTSNR